MENGQEENKAKTVISDAVDGEVKNEKPVSDENSDEKQTSDEPSSELLEKIKNQIEVLFYE